MKLLLTAINAKYIHSNLAVYSLRASALAALGRAEARGREGGLLAPAAAGAPASDGALAPDGASAADPASPLPVEIALAEFTINHRTEDILREIYLRKPDVLLFSCYIWNIVYVRELAENCRKIMPEVPIWLGGPEVSYDAEAFLRENPAVDGILCGEGEETFCRLAEYYGQLAEYGGQYGRDAGRYGRHDCQRSGQRSGQRPGQGQAGAARLKEIPGLVYREPDRRREEPGQPEGKGSIQVNPPAPLPDLDALPFPYSDLADFENRIIYYESSRGCPFSCSYCLSSIEKSVRFRKPETVCRELQFFLDRRVPQVKFVDRTFNCRKSHAMAIWTYILEHDNGITNFHFEIEAELLCEEELELLSRMRPGLVQLEIGVQSANPKTLAAVRRRTDLDRLRETVLRIRRGRNIHQHLDLIAGLPFEDYESFGRSFDRVFAMEPEQLQLGFLKVLKGAAMYGDAARYGIVYKSQPPYEVLSTPWLSFSDLLRLKAIEEMVEIYYNSHQFGRTLERLVPAFPSPFAFFEELARYYEGRQEGQKSSRARKYELLLDFAAERFPKEEARYRELLTIDYYLRERAKARPSFAPDQSLHREELRKLLKELPRQVHVEAVSAGAAKALWKAPGGAAAEPDGEAEAAFLVFDYEKRDPLTGDALLTKVSLESGARQMEELLSPGAGAEPAGYDSAGHDPAGHDTEEVRKK